MPNRLPKQTMKLRPLSLAIAAATCLPLATNPAFAANLLVGNGGDGGVSSGTFAAGSGGGGGIGGGGGGGGAGDGAGAGGGLARGGDGDFFSGSGGNSPGTDGGAAGASGTAGGQAGVGGGGGAGGGPGSMGGGGSGGGALGAGGGLGNGGAGGDGGAIVGIDGTPFAGTAGQRAQATVAGTSFSPTAYDYVGIGGGGGGAGKNVSGNDGSAGILTVSNATLTVNRSLLLGGGGGGGSLSVNGGRGGDGSLTLMGAGLSVANTLLIGGAGGGNGASYTGSGFGAGGQGGNGTLTVAGNSTVSIGTGARLVLGGGTGGGAGVLNLGQGMANFAGGGAFTINTNGTLNIGSETPGASVGGTIENLSSLINNGRINFNQSGIGTYALVSSISGSGSVAVNSGATTVLLGNNTYTGGTTVSAGILQIGGGGVTGSVSGDIVNNTAVVFNRSDTVDYSGIMSGAGRLNKTGAGTLTLSGANTYTGGTQVNAGTLVAAHNQALGTGNVTVGTVAALEVTSGTALTVGGNLDFQSGSIYRVYANPNSAASSRIDVTGTANLAGSVLHVGAELDGATDFQVGKTYTILHAAGGLAGSKFSASASLFAYLNTTLSYTTTDVTLKLERKGSSTGGGSMGFAELANTPNQGGTANAIESLPSTHPLYQYVETLPAGTPAAVFNSLSGDAHSTVMGSVNMLSAQAPNISQQHLHNNLTAGFRPGAPTAQAGGTLPASALPSSKALPAWVEVVGHWQKMDGNSNTPGVKQNTTGLFLGADEEVGNSGWRVGGSVGYTSADAKVSSRDASSDISSYSAAVYTGKGFSHGANRINVIGGLAYTKHSIESERSVATLNQNLKADYSAHTAQLFAEVGYAMGQYDKQGFEPFVGITLGEQRTDSFKESGGFAALSSESSRDTLASTTLGVRAHSDFVVAGKDTRVRASLGVRHAWGNLSQNRTMAFEGSSSFTVAGAPLARNTALVGLQAEVALSRYSALVLGYNGEFGSGSRDQSANVKVRWAF